MVSKLKEGELKIGEIQGEVLGKDGGNKGEYAKVFDKIASYLELVQNQPEKV